MYGVDYPPIIGATRARGQNVYVPRPPFFNRFSKGISFQTNTVNLRMDKANRYINTNPILNCIPYSMDIAPLIS